MKASISVPPEKCARCKAEEIQCQDAGLYSAKEYRETYECLVCGETWQNLYRYAKTKVEKRDEE